MTTRYDLSVHLPAEGTELAPTITSSDPRSPLPPKTRTLCPSVEVTLGLLVARAFHIEEQLDALPPSVRTHIPANVVMSLLVTGGLVSDYLDVEVLDATVKRGEN